MSFLNKRGLNTQIGYIKAYINNQIATVTAALNNKAAATHTHQKSEFGLGYVDNTADNTKNVATAAALTTPHTIDGVMFSGATNITHYGICTIAAETAAKTVACSNFILSEGAIIYVKFTNGNTATTPTLNVAGTGAIAIQCGSEVPSIAANKIYGFIYDGTSYQKITS